MDPVVYNECVRAEFALEAVKTLACAQARSEEERAGRAATVARVQDAALLAAATGDAQLADEVCWIAEEGLLALGVDPERISEFFGFPTWEA